MRKNILLHVIGLSLAALLSTGALVSCGGDNPATPDDPNKENPVPNPPGPTPDPDHITDVKVLTSNEMTTVKEVQSNGTVVFEGTSMKDLKVGSALVSGIAPNAPEGFLYKVKSVNVKDGMTYVTTEQARLDQVIEDGSGKGQFNMVDNIASITGPDGQPIEIVKTKDTDISASAGIEIPIESYIPIHDGFKVGLKGSVEIKAEVYFDIDFKKWTLQYFEFWVQPELKVDVRGSLIYKGKEVNPFKSMELNRETYLVDICTVKGTPVSIQVGLIPVVVTPVYKCAINVSLGGEIELSAKIIDLDYKYRIGAMKNSSGYHLINENLSEEPVFFDIANDESLSLKMKGSASIGPTCGFFPAFYGWECKNLQVELSAPFTASISDFDFGAAWTSYVNPKVKLSWGVDAKLKFNFEPLISEDKFKFEPTWNIVEIVLVEENIFPNFSKPEVVNSTGSTANIRYTVDEFNSMFNNLEDYGLAYCEGYLGSGKQLTKISKGAIKFEGYNHEWDQYPVDFKLENLKPDAEYSAYPYFVPKTIVPFLATAKLGEELHFKFEESGMVRFSAYDIDFGNVPTGSTRNKRLTLTNTGVAAAKISSVECPAGFSTDFKGERTIQSGDSYVLTVRFSPTKKEAYSGVIKIMSGSDTYEIDVTGKGSDRSDGKVELSPSKIVFGDYDVGDYDTKILYVKNTGTDECYVSSIECPDGFEADPAGDFVLEKDKTKTVKVTFRPTMGRDYRGELTVQSDASNGDQSIIVSGTGIQHTPAKLVLSTDALSFGRVDVGKTKTISFRVMNQGNTPANVNGIYCSSGFSADITNSLVIDGGASLVVNVTFAPTEQRPYTGLLTVESDAVDPEVTLDLAGVGSNSTSTELDVSETKLVFGEVREGEKAVKPITLTNTGSRAIKVSTISCPDGFTTDFNDNTSIPAKSSANVKVTFHSTMGVHKGDLIIRSDADNGDQLVEVSGIGIESPKTNLILSTHSIDFGEIFIGELAVRQFTATNTGSRPIKISSISCPAGFAPNYTEPVTLQAGSVLSVEILFKPTASSHSGNVVIKSDADNGDQIVSIIGKGISNDVPMLTFTTDNLDLGEAKVGASVSQKIGIVNSGKASAFVSALNIPASFTSDLKEKTEIKANSTLYFNVQFVPERARKYYGTFYVEFANNVGSKSVSLNGTGKEPIDGIVDLGLSVYWATCNLDASSPEGIGGYYAFGETSTKSEYTWENCKWYDTQIGFTKYNSDPQEGTVDNRTVLEPADDAVTVKKGGLWRTPTVDEVDEMLLYCSFEYGETVGGVRGCTFTSNVPGFTDKSIFIPFGGLRNDDEYTHAGESGYYQTSTPHWHLRMNVSEEMDKARICDGMTIRPVYGAPAQTNSFDFQLLKNKARAMDNHRGVGLKQHSAVGLPKRDRPAPLE